jgi:uncharacterized protein (TIGR03382 family)
MTKLAQRRILRIAEMKGLLIATAILVGAANPVGAAITLTADPAYPAFPDIFTTNPAAFGTSAHGFADTRMLRQTFKNSVALDIGQIILSLDLNGTDGSLNEGGLVVNIYQVDDVNAATWQDGNPALIKTWTVPVTQSIPATNFRLGLDFSGADVFNLPQRDAGTTGYGIEISSVDGVTAMGTWAVTPADEIDRYVDGVFYREDGTVSRVYRDAGLSILSSSALPAVEGDVNNDRQVTLEDFNIITNNFRNSVGSRLFGDLTGDGVVDFADFRDWKSNYVPPGSGIAAEAVPEPASALLAVAGLVFASGLRRRRGSAALRIGSAPHATVVLRTAGVLLCGVFGLLLATPVSRAAVTFSVDPPYPVGADLGAFTLDPEGLGTAQRGIAGTRLLRQTFQVDQTFFVGGAVLAADMNGADGGMILSFYEVADVNANTWVPLGNPLKRITIPAGVDLPDTTVRLGLELTGSDSFTLPQRNTGVEGYGIEISNADEMTTIGLIRHSNDGVDNYAFGKFYTESGNQSSATRDWGISLVTTDIEPPGPGDVNEDFNVDLADLTIIRTNFGNSVAGRTQGDLSGDGLVFFDDFREWKDNYPPANPSAAISAQVPEPGSSLLVLVGWLACLAAPWRRCQWVRVRA